MSRSTLLLRLVGPLQGWGSTPVKNVRPVGLPSKSAVVGLVATALGRRPGEDVADIVALDFGVREDARGVVLRDFQTEPMLDKQGSDNLPVYKGKDISHREYRTDAAYLAALNGESGFVSGLAEGIRRPVLGLYLGRRTCLPSAPIFLDVVRTDVRETLMGTELIVPGAPPSNSMPAGETSRRCLVVRDVTSGEVGTQMLRDVPLSTDPAHRVFGMRPAVSEVFDIDATPAPRSRRRPRVLNDFQEAALPPPRPLVLNSIDGPCDCCRGSGTG